MLSRRPLPPIELKTKNSGLRAAHKASAAAGQMQALGFCRASDRPEDQLRAVVGRTGLIRFWDCCGAEEEAAPGCCTSRHVTYDDPVD
jgi:hypothetical protein